MFVRRAQEALSVARVRGNGCVWKQGLQAMAYGGGRCYQIGLASAHRRSGLIVHADVVMTSVSIVSRRACSEHHNSIAVTPRKIDLVWCHATQSQRLSHSCNQACCFVAVCWDELFVVPHARFPAAQGWKLNR